MFSVWDINGVPAHHNRGRVAPVLPGDQPLAYDEDAVEHEAVYQPPKGRARARAAQKWQEALEEEQRERRQPAVLAEQIMTTPVRHISPTTTVGAAWAEMGQARLRHLPVLNETGRLVGILSDRDLLRVAGTPDQHPLRPVQNRPVSDIMRTRVVSAHPDAPIREVARLMVEQRIGCVPIIDDDLDLVGVVTRGDVLRTMVHEAPMDLWI